MLRQRRNVWGHMAMSWQMQTMSQDSIKQHRISSFREQELIELQKMAQ